MLCQAQVCPGFAGHAGKLLLVFRRCPLWCVSDGGRVPTGGKQQASQTSQWVKRCGRRLMRSHRPSSETCKVLGPWEGRNATCSNVVVPRSISPWGLWEKWGWARCDTPEFLNYVLVLNKSRVVACTRSLASVPGP